VAARKKPRVAHRGHVNGWMKVSQLIVLPGNCMKILREAVTEGGGATG
jgi:hypothetical protein